MAKSSERLQAIILRKKGESIKEIAGKLKVSVGSVSAWCRNVKLSKKQINALEQRAKDPYYGRRLSYSLEQQRIRKEKTSRLIKEGIAEIHTLNKRELLIAGIALYWAEGFKKDSQVGLASMDPFMIMFYIKWLITCFGYHKEDLNLRVTLNISHKNRIGKVEKYWSDITGIPKKDFGKPFYQNFVWKKTYENPEDYYGVLRVKVRKSTDFLRKIKGYIEGLRLQAKME
jgi:hypothetical protein